MPNKNNTTNIIKQNILFDKQDSLIVKGAAILLMVYLHSVASRHLSFNPIVDDFIGTIGNVCVTMFAFVSVYGIAKKCNAIGRKDNPKVIIKRLISLYGSYIPMYLFTLLITFITDLIYNSNRIATAYTFAGGGIKAFGTAILNMLGLSFGVFGDKVGTINSAWWYMTAAIVIIIITPLVYMLSTKIQIVIAILWIPLIFISHAYLPFQFWYLIQIASLVFIGIFISKKQIFWKNRIWTLPIHIALAAVGLIAIYNFKELVDFKMLIYSLITYSIAVVVIYIFRILKPVSWFMKYMGRKSANIFYMHSFVYLYWTLTADLINKLKYGVLVWIATLAITLVFSYLVDFIKDKTGWNRLCNYLIDRIK